jgi:hypothetical protein
MLRIGVAARDTTLRNHLRRHAPVKSVTCLTPSPNKFLSNLTGHFFARFHEDTSRQHFEAAVWQQLVLDERFLLPEL